MSYCIIKMTERELQETLYALENSTDHPDVMRSLFSDTSARNAAYRGAVKMRQALDVTRLDIARRQQQRLLSANCEKKVVDTSTES